QYLQETLDTLANCCTDLVETTACKALALFCPDTPGLTSSEAVSKMRERVASGLEEYCGGKRGEEEKDRMATFHSMVSTLRSALKPDEIATAVLGEACKLNEVFLEVFSTPASLLSTPT
ncbi:hypothetical protein PENTCL1PPCAC_20110, partial [Pristionchus entomophagus]